MMCRAAGLQANDLELCESGDVGILVGGLKTRVNLSYISYGISKCYGYFVRPNLVRSILLKAKKEDGVKNHTFVVYVG